MNRPSDRRRFSRRDSTEELAVEVAAESLTPVPGAIHNISRGGVLLRLREIPSGATESCRCVVRFAGAAGGVLPSVSRGRILRSDATAAGVQLAIEFSEPLVALPR